MNIVDRLQDLYILHRKATIIACVVVACAIGIWIFKIYNGVTKEIIYQGEKIVVNYGQHHIVATPEMETRQSFLINNGFLTTHGYYYFYAIPMDRVNDLKKQYGDIFHCDSPGAASAKSSVIMLILFPENASVEAKLREILNFRLNSPVIEIKAARLLVTEHTYNKKIFSTFDPSIPETYYLVSDAYVIHEHYQ